MSDKYKEDYPGHPLHNFYTRLRELERRIEAQKRTQPKPRRRVAPLAIKRPSPKKGK